MVIRLLAVIIAGFAIWSAFMAGERTGNYLGLLIVLVASGAYVFIDIHSHRGTALYAFQYLLVRSLVALAVIGLGIFIIYLGVSELTEPLQFDRPRRDAAVYVIRQLVGSLGLAILLVVFGAIVIFRGYRMLPGSGTQKSR